MKVRAVFNSENLLAQGLPLSRKAPMIFPPYGHFDAVTDRGMAA